MPDMHNRIEHDFTNHAPESHAIVATFVHLRSKFKELAHDIVDVCPEGRELSLALTYIEQALMFSIAACARNQGAFND